MTPFGASRTSLIASEHAREELAGRATEPELASREAMIEARFAEIRARSSDVNTPGGLRNRRSPPSNHN
jgi:hypothetical protein